MAEEKKSIFKKIGEALSSKDEKEALEKAQAELEQVKEQAAEALKAKETAEKEAAKEKLAEQAEKYKEAAEARRAELEAKKKLAEEEAKKNAVIAEHTVAQDETLSHIALKYYKSATKPYYMLIYEFNKEVIGENPNIIKPGMLLKIPVLPEELKK